MNYYSIKDLKTKLKLSTPVIYKYINNNIIPATKIDGFYKIPKTVFDVILGCELKQFLTPVEFAEQNNVSSTYIYRLIKKGEIKVVRIGNLIRIPEGTKYKAKEKYPDFEKEVERMDK